MVVLRLTERGSGLRERIRLTAFPARVGRSPLCNGWIDHPSVSAFHAEIRREGDGRFVLTDLASRNGVLVDGERVGSLTLESGRRFHLGAVEVEFLEVEGELETTQEIPLPPAPVVTREELRGTLQAAAVFLGTMLLYHGMEATDGEWMSFFRMILIGFPVAALAGVGLALLCKLHGKRYRTFRCLREVLELSSVTLLVLVLLPLLTFNLFGDDVGLWFEGFALTGLLFFSLLKLGRLVFDEQPLGRLLKWSASVTAILVAIGAAALVLDYLRGDGFHFDGAVSYPLPWVKGASVDTLLGDMDRSIAVLKDRRRER